MPLYQFHCGKCKETFDEYVYLAGKKNPTPPEWRKCKKCGKRALREYATEISIQSKSDWKTKKSIEKFQTEGYDKKSGDDFLNRSIELSKKRMTDGSSKSHYTPMVPVIDRHLETGMARKATEAEKKDRKVAAKQVAEYADKKGIDRTKSNNNQTFK